MRTESITASSVGFILVLIANIVLSTCGVGDGALVMGMLFVGGSIIAADTRYEQRAHFYNLQLELVSRPLSPCSMVRLFWKKLPWNLVSG